MTKNETIQEIKNLESLSEFWHLAIWMVGIGWGVTLIVVPTVDLAGLPAMIMVCLWVLSYVLSERARGLKAMLTPPPVGARMLLATTDARLEWANGAEVTVTAHVERDGEPALVEIEFAPAYWHSLGFKKEQVWGYELVACDEPF